MVPHHNCALLGHQRNNGQIMVKNVKILKKQYSSYRFWLILTKLGWNLPYTVPHYYCAFWAIGQKSENLKKTTLTVFDLSCPNLVGTFLWWSLIIFVLIFGHMPKQHFFCKCFFNLCFNLFLSDNFCRNFRHISSLIQLFAYNQSVIFVVYDKKETF